MAKRIQAALSGLFIFSVAHAASDIHVTTGFALDAANKLARPGDTVIFDKDISGSLVFPAKSGEDGKPITYNLNGHTLTAPAAKTCVKLVNKKYIHVIGGSCDGGAPYKKSKVVNFLVMDNSQYNVLENLDFNNAQGWYGVLIDGGSDYNKLLNVDISNVGTYCDPSRGQYCMAGDGLALLDADHNLIQGGTLQGAGHNLFGIYGSSNIMRDMTLIPNWSNRKGYRAGEISFNKKKNPNATGHNVFEDSIIKFGGEPPTGIGETAIKVEGISQIVRNIKFISNSQDAAMSSIERDEIPISRDGRVYNITVIDQQKLWDMRSPVSGYVFKNIAGSAKLKAGVAGKNVLVASRFGDDLKLDDNYCPKAGSPLIDTGAVLTKTKSAGEGTVIPVEDAGYFSDGEGVVEGYKVQVGNAVARIQKVDYAKNTLNVEPAIKWAKGDGVSPPYSGKTPDIGACEYQAAPEPEPIPEPEPEPDPCKDK